MKTTLLIFTAIVLSSTSFAQLTKGGMMIAGNFSYFKSRSAEKDTSVFSGNQISNSKSFSASIRYGYFVTDKIVVGIYVGYDNSIIDSKRRNFDGYIYGTNTNSSTFNSIGAGVFSRYYKMLGKSKFALFGQLSGGYSSGKQKQKQVVDYSGNITTYNSHSDLSAININFNPGLVYFVTKNIAIETSFGNLGFRTQLSKNYGQNDSYNETRTSSFNTNLALALSNLSWGIHFYFGGSKNNASLPDKN